MITPPLILIGAIIVIALVFDFTNGFHDSANSISTVVSTKVLSPRNAVVFAAFFNFLAAFGFGVAVADTIASIVNLDVVAATIIPYIVLAALAGAISWNLITWFFGLPTSSSHALIGGLAGAGISAAGIAVIKWSTLGQVTLFMVLSPLIGLICGFLFMAAILWLTRKSNKPTTEGYFKRLQTLFCGSVQFQPRYKRRPENDGDHRSPPFFHWVLWCERGCKPPVGPLLGYYHLLHHHRPWNPLRRMENCKDHGVQDYQLRLVQGFAAETAGAVTILSASSAGIPVSHDPCDLRIHYGCRCDRGIEHGQVGRRTKHRDCMDSDDTY